MATLIVTTRGGDMRELEDTGGRSVMEVIRDAGVDELLAICGGCLSCATCHVFVHPDDVARLPAMAQDENDLLQGSAHRTSTSRLSCQLQFGNELDGLRVTVAPEEA